MIHGVDNLMNLTGEDAHLAGDFIDQMQASHSSLLAAHKNSQLCVKGYFY